ncbi:hypothetical protein SO694_00085172 [Aureococcus anophagefferens]|uniref:Uncharacterized protein n=1 Tax=Aureococcus anophagefferens TaxID=44056 RepID=A0ABR1G3R1_AURAN
MSTVARGVRVTDAWTAAMAHMTTGAKRRGAASEARGGEEEREDDAAGEAARDRDRDGRELRDPDLERARAVRGRATPTTALVASAAGTRRPWGAADADAWPSTTFWSDFSPQKSVCGYRTASSPTARPAATRAGDAAERAPQRRDAAHEELADRRAGDADGHRDGRARAALKVVVIDALPFQRKLWSERIGAGFVAVTSPEVLAGALARADATHVVSCVRGHALVDRVRRRTTATWTPHYEFHDGDGAGFRLLERFFARLAAVDVGGAPFLHPHRTMGGLIGAKEAPKLGIRHCFVRSPAVPGAFRQVDFILCPTEIIAHGLLGWSGSTSFQRSLRDYVNHAHEKNWAEVPDRRPIVGRRGWNVTRDGTRVGSLIEGRELDEDEHWAWSQNGIAIARGKHSSKGKDGEQFETTYEECNINLRTEADVFRFFHLDYRAPHERCA